MLPIGLCAAITSFTALGQVKDINLDTPKLKLSIGAIATDNINPTLQDDLSAQGLEAVAYGSLTSPSEGVTFGVDYYASHQAFHSDEGPALFDESQGFSTFNARVFSRFYLDKSWTLDAEASHLYTDQRFGFGLSRFRQNILEQDTLNSSTVGTTLVYGKETDSRYATFNIRAREDNYDDTNFYSSLFDLSQKVAEFNLVYRRSATGVAIKLDATDDDFDDITRTDSQLYRALIGVDWQSTGKSRFKALVGRYWRDVETQENDSGLTWQLDYLYSPRSDINIQVSSLRTSQESELENAVDSVIESYRVGLQYRYSNQWQYSLDINSRATEFNADQGAAVIADLDENNITASVTAKLSDHSQLVLNYMLQDVSSDDNAIDYQQNEFKLSWQYVF